MSFNVDGFTPQEVSSYLDAEWSIAVRAGLHSLGHADVRDVRVGKIVELTLEATDADAARARVERMCQELLANPTIESFELELELLPVETD